MPLTISHPAAVVPLSRLGLNIPALVIGSIIPDIIYFFHLTSYRDVTHSLAGLFLFCLPAGLALLGVYQVLLREPILSLLRPGDTEKYEKKRHSLKRRLAVAAASIVAGAATHLLWDSFTHEEGVLLEYLPFLSASVLDLGFDKVPLSRILHHGSSVTGAVLVVGWAGKHIRTGRARIVVRSAVPLALSVFLGVFLSWMLGGPIKTYAELRTMFVGGIFTSGTVLLSFIFAYSLYWRLAPRRSESGPGLDSKKI